MTGIAVPLALLQTEDDENNQILEKSRLGNKLLKNVCHIVFADNDAVRRTQKQLVELVSNSRSALLQTCWGQDLCHKNYDVSNNFPGWLSFLSYFRHFPEVRKSYCSDQPLHHSDLCYTSVVLYQVADLCLTGTTTA